MYRKNYTLLWYNLFFTLQQCRVGQELAGRIFPPRPPTPPQNPGKQTLQHAESHDCEQKNENAMEWWTEEKAKERQGQATCVLQAHLFGLFTCKSLLIRGWRRADDRSRLSSPPVMQAYLRALRLYRVNSALTERHAAEQPGGTATPGQHARDAGTLYTLTQGYWHMKAWQRFSVWSQGDFSFTCEKCVFIYSRIAIT